MSSHAIQGRVAKRGYVRMDVDIVRVIADAIFDTPSPAVPFGHYHSLLQARSVLDALRKEGVDV